MAEVFLEFGGEAEEPCACTAGRGENLYPSPLSEQEQVGGKLASVPTSPQLPLPGYSLAHSVTHKPVVLSGSLGK